MIISSEFKAFVENDIERIDKAIKDGLSKSELVELHSEIEAKYQSCVMNWYQGLSFAYFPKGGTPFIDYGDLSAYENEIIYNLKSMKSKLEVYTFGMNAVSLPEPPTTTVNVTTSVNLNVTFEQVRSQIEDMTSLTDKETEEILTKISVLEEIIGSKEKKKSKWEKAKSILAWLADKSFDVAMTILPLLLKINE